ncbi:hypothetical protein GE061_018508 [Apolygus lucorum]|uniref:Protein kinase domain-containing protein n=1 Tax=Apolygus lucorum TaxID=248454 RepID=A0A8S9XE56_APOLU|nr:hypothetical protein GE061_018508 [Apolygus lucorum]
MVQSSLTLVTQDSIITDPTVSSRRSRVVDNSSCFPFPPASTFEMDLHSTPKASSRESDNTGSPFVVPPTPVLRKIGWGTGVTVYHMDRSPFSGVARSPWALKKVMRAPKRKTFIGSRLKIEADILKKLNHPNIVGFRCFTKTKDGREVLAMEECEESLGTILENRYENKAGPLEAELIIKIVYEVCKALRYVHSEHRIIHGDIKSYNILIKGMGVPGLAKILEREESHVKLVTGMSMGKILRMGLVPHLLSVAPFRVGYHQILRISSQEV